MIANAFRTTTEPTFEPLMLQEVKDHLRIDSTDEDALLDALIQSARGYLEGLLGRVIPEQSVTAYYSTFCDELILPRAAPLQSVTSVKYLDTDGALQTLGTSYYDVYTWRTPGEVRLADGYSWPSTQTGVTDTVRIEYVAGWGSPQLVPSAIRQALLLLIAHWYENRESSTPLTINDVPVSFAALTTAYQVGWL